MAIPDRLRAAARQHDAALAGLIRSGIDFRQSGRALLAEMQARRAELQQRHAALEQAHVAANVLLPEILDLYMNGSDDDRRDLRDLLVEHKLFRWSLGWNLFGRIVTTEDARNALAVLSLKDGGSDWRDEIVSLDHLCGVMRKAGMPVADLLTQAAEWSSDVSNFPDTRSTRALLLGYAERFS